jgi:hypothetical protein
MVLDELCTPKPTISCIEHASSKLEKVELENHNLQKSLVEFHAQENQTMQ